MSRIADTYRANPATLNAFIAAAIGLAVSLGVNIPEGFEASFVVLITIIAGLVTRQQVTPVIDGVAKEVGPTGKVYSYPNSVRPSE